MNFNNGTDSMSILLLQLQMIQSFMLSVIKNHTLGDFQEWIYPNCTGFLFTFNDCMDAGGRATQEQLPRRKKGRIASYATLFTTKKMDKKTSKLGIFFAENRLSKSLFYTYIEIKGASKNPLSVFNKSLKQDKFF